MGDTGTGGLLGHGEFGRISFITLVLRLLSILGNAMSACSRVTEGWDGCLR